MRKVIERGAGAKSDHLPLSYYNTTSTCIRQVFMLLAEVKTEGGYEDAKNLAFFDISGYDAVSARLQQGSETDYCADL